MSIEKISKTEVRNLYINNQQRGSKRLPICAELICEDWYKGKIKVQELWELNPQIYVGYRLNKGGKKTQDDSGYLTYELWKQMNYDSKLQSISKGFQILRDNNVYSDSKVKEQVKKITDDLGRVPLENEDCSIILLNSHGVVPYSTGSTIDGVRRLTALFDLYQKGNIQDEANVNVLIGDFNDKVCLAYNAAAAVIDTKPIEERVELLAERDFASEILFTEHID